jgi:hypothetical protein
VALGAGAAELLGAALGAGVGAVVGSGLSEASLAVLPEPVQVAPYSGVVLGFCLYFVMYLGRRGSSAPLSTSWWFQELATTGAFRPGKGLRRR